jgi:glycosyltransferase involved in cell wall biosynthesis
MTKVLIYCPVFYPENTGYTNAFSQLIHNLLSHNCKVDVVIRQLLPAGQQEWKQHPNLNITRLNPTFPVWFIGLMYRFYTVARVMNRMFEKQQYDMVLAETGDDPYLFLFLSKKILKKTVVRFHSTSDTEYYLYSHQRKYKIKFFFWKYISGKRVQHYAATSSYHLGFIKEHILRNNTSAITGKSFQIITNAITKTDFVTLPKQATKRSFITLARLDEEGYKQKGIAILLEALTACKEDFLQSGNTFLLIGKGNKEGMVEDKIKTNGLTFVQWIPSTTHEQTIDLLQKSSVVVLPSLYEGVSVFALESLATGNAVIYSQTGGLMDMLQNNGVAVEPGNVEQLAAAIKVMIHKTSLEDFQQASIKLCAERFSEEYQWEQCQAVIQRVS